MVFIATLILILIIFAGLTGLPRSGLATREPAKDAERVASHVARGRDRVNSTPTSFLVVVVVVVVVKMTKTTPESRTVSRRT